jgi:hypothetical protein
MCKIMSLIVGSSVVRIYPKRKEIAEGDIELPDSVAAGLQYQQLLICISYSYHSM